MPNTVRKTSMSSIAQAPVFSLYTPSFQQAEELHHIQQQQRHHLQQQRKHQEFHHKRKHDEDQAQSTHDEWVLGKRFRTLSRSTVSLNQASLLHSSQLLHQIPIPLPIAILCNEYDFARWVGYIESVCSELYEDYLVFDFSRNNHSDIYQQKLATANALCSHNLIINSKINQLFQSTIHPCLITQLTSFIASENFENIKSIFLTNITAQYLVNFESSLQLGPGNIATTLNDIEFLSKIYNLVFGKLSNENLKVQWIMNAIYKNSMENKDVINEINCDWEKSTDYSYIRNVLVGKLIDL